MQIIFNNFKIKTIIGVYPEEKQKLTEISISLKIDFDAEKATLSDQLEDTIDYDKLARILNDFATKEHNLIESLSRKIINKIIENFSLIEKIEVEIIKPDIVPQAEIVAIKDYYVK